LPAFAFGAGVAAAAGVVACAVAVADAVAFGAADGAVTAADVTFVAEEALRDGRTFTT
jgi:hypothetical protein